MRTATAGVILAAEATLGWSVGLRSAAFLVYVALWVIVLVLCELRAVWITRTPMADRPEPAPAQVTERHSELV